MTTFPRDQRLAILAAAVELRDVGRATTCRASPGVLHRFPVASQSAFGEYGGATPQPHRGTGA